MPHFLGGSWAELEEAALLQKDPQDPTRYEAYGSEWVSQVQGTLARSQQEPGVSGRQGADGRSGSVLSTPHSGHAGRGRLLCPGERCVGHPASPTLHPKALSPAKPGVGGHWLSRTLGFVPSFFLAKSLASFLQVCKIRSSDERKLPPAGPPAPPAPPRLPRPQASPSQVLLWHKHWLHEMGLRNVTHKVQGP